MNLLDIIGQLSQRYNSLIIGTVTILVVGIAYKLLSIFISRTGERLHLEAHAMNGLRLLLRVAAIVVAFYTVFTVFRIPTTIFVGGSALIGAFLGFGSSQTINNIVAGFYVLVTQPFKVKDYVKIGDLEGQIEEITVNYTNLYTPTFNLLKVPNTQVMNSRVLNMTHEGFIKYTFTVGFSHELPNEVLMEKCIQPAIDEFHDKHEADQLRKPEVYIDHSGWIERSFLIRFFIPKGEARSLYVLKPELLAMIMERWDKLRKR